MFNSAKEQHIQFVQNQSFCLQQMNLVQLTISFFDKM